MKDKNLQYKALEAEKDNYKELHRVAKAKSIIQLAAATAFLGAASLATMKAVKKEVNASECAIAFEKSIGNVHALGPNPEAITCLSALKVGLTSFFKHEAAMKLPNQSKLKYIKNQTFQKESIARDATCAGSTAPLVMEQKKACKGHFLNSEKSLVMCEQTGVNVVGFDNTFEKLINYKVDNFLIGQTPKSEIAKVKSIIKKVFIEGLDLVLPESRADFKKYLGLSGIAAGVAIGLIAVKKNLVDFWISTPSHRAILFGGAGAMIGTASYISKSISINMNSNVEKIEKVIEQHRAFQAQQNFENSSNTENSGPKNPSTTDIRTVTTSPLSFPENINSKNPCFTSSLRSDDCTQISSFTHIQDKNVSKNINDNISSIATDTVSLANSIQNSRGINLANLSLAKKIAGKNAFAIKSLKGLRGRLNDQIEKGKIAPKDFSLARLEDNFNNTHRIETIRYLNTKNIDNKGLLASLKGFIPKESLSGSQNIGLSRLKSNPPESNRRYEGSMQEAIDIYAKQARDDLKKKQEEAYKIQKFRLDDLQMKASFDAEIAKVGVTGNKESPQIEKDRKKGLFQIISERYQITAFPIFFDEKDK
jgi:hypothetical protein